MKEIIIEPHIGIGQLKLGMTSDELENALLQMKKQWSNSSDEAMQMTCSRECTAETRARISCEYTPSSIRSSAGRNHPQ